MGYDQLSYEPTDPRDAEIARLKARNDKLDSRYGYEVGQNEHLRARIEELNEDIAGLHGDWLSVTIERDELLTERDEWAEDHRYSNKLIEELERAARWYREYFKDADEEIEELRTRLASYEKQIESQSGTIKTLFAELDVYTKLPIVESETLKPSITGHTPNPDLTIDDLRKEVERLRAKGKGYRITR